MIRDEFDGALIIMYHPTVTINTNGSMTINSNETDSVFAEVCDANGIIYVDMGEAFLQAYLDDYSVPYGFHNTSMGEGHLNKEGHLLIAEELYEILNGGDVE